MHKLSVLYCNPLNFLNALTWVILLFLPLLIYLVPIITDNLLSASWNYRTNNFEVDILGLFTGSEALKVFFTEES